MTLLYVGDIHSRVKDLGGIVNSAETRGIKTIIQVGDFGVLWPNNSTSEMDNFLKKRARQGKWTTEILTVFGNHDNWDEFYRLHEEQGRPDKVELYPGSGVFCVSRGSMLDINGISHLFMGGAESTDQHHRTPGLSWWDREEPSKEEFDIFFDNLENKKPDTVISHDAPLRVQLYRMRRNASTTPNMLENALRLSSHKPKNWLFGHHHMLKKWKVDGVKFRCCGLHGQYWQREDISGWTKKE
jgi:predicted phosphodiesterase